VKTLVINVELLSEIDRKLMITIENFALASCKTVSSADGAARAVANLVRRFIRACLAVFELNALLAVLVFAADRVERVDWFSRSVMVKLVSADKAVATVREVFCIVKIRPKIQIIKYFQKLKSVFFRFKNLNLAPTGKVTN